MSTATNGNSGITLPKWFWNFAVLGTMGALTTAIAVWAATELQAARTSSEAHAEALGVLKQRVDTHEKQFDKIDAKLDRIWEEVRK